MNLVLRSIRPLRAIVAGFAAASLLAGIALAAPLRGIISAEDLARRVAEKRVTVLDIRSGETREKGAALFRTGHVPGAIHADYAHASWRLPQDNTSVYLPEPAQFEALAGELGVSNESDIVVVHDGEDQTSFGAAARVYWTFKAMGHGSIAILDGGYRAWRNAGLPVSTESRAPEAAIYEAKPNPALRASLADVRAAEAGKVTLVDSRPESFYSGLEKHKAIKAFGHIPGAVSVPHSRAFGADNKLLDRKTLASNFAPAGEGATITYCNTGHWAATDWFVLSEILGKPDVRMFDGSMFEYSRDEKAPVSNPRGTKGS